MQSWDGVAESEGKERERERVKENQIPQLLSKLLTLRGTEGQGAMAYELLDAFKAAVWEFGSQGSHYRVVCPKHPVLSSVLA